MTHDKNSTKLSPGVSTDGLKEISFMSHTRMINDYDILKQCGEYVKKALLYSVRYLPCRTPVFITVYGTVVTETALAVES
jgi:hypothetical protein